MRWTRSRRDEGCDALLVMNCPTALASSEAAADVVVESHERQRAAHKRAKPLLTNWLGDGAAAASRKRFANAGIPTFETPDGAVCGFMQLVHYKRAQDELMQTPPSLPGGLHFDRERANAIIAAALRAGRKVLSEVEAKGLLASYGVPVVRTETVAADPAAVEAVASDILAHDDACVLKILSDDISHKSDVGGVRLAIKTPQEAADAARTMLAKVHAALPKASIRGFTIQPMIVRPHAHELIVGMSDDATVRAADDVRRRRHRGRGGRRHRARAPAARHEARGPAHWRDAHKPSAGGLPRPAACRHRLPSPKRSCV